MSISLDLDKIYHEKYQNVVYYFLPHRNQMYVFSTSFILMYNCQLPKYNNALDDKKLHVEMGDKTHHFCRSCKFADLTHGTTKEAGLLPAAPLIELQKLKDELKIGRN